MREYSQKELEAAATPDIRAGITSLPGSAREITVPVRTLDMLGSGRTHSSPEDLLCRLEEDSNLSVLRFGTRLLAERASGHSSGVAIPRGVDLNNYRGGVFMDVETRTDPVDSVKVGPRPFTMPEDPEDPGAPENPGATENPGALEN